MKQPPSKKRRRSSRKRMQNRSTAKRTMEFIAQKRAREEWDRGMFGAPIPKR